MAPIPWIIVFPPVARFQQEAYLARSRTVSLDEEKSLSLKTACDEAFQTVKEFVKRSSSNDCHTSNFGAPCKHETFGGLEHLENLANNLVELAYDFYLDVYVKSLSKKPIDLYIIAAESGVYLAMKVINFLAKHGFNPVFMDDVKKFDKAWVNFLLGGEELPTEWPQELVDISIISAVFIHPSLPSPSSPLPVHRPRFYSKNPPPVVHAMQRRVLVVWFRSHLIDASAYEEIPISGQHHDTQMLEFDSVLNTSYKMALQTLVENLDSPCSECE